MNQNGGSTRRWIGFLFFMVLTFAIVIIDVVNASNVAVGLDPGGGSTPDVPTWLYLITGGAVVGASAFISMVLTDRELISRIHGAKAIFNISFSGRGLIHELLGISSVLALIFIVYIGFNGPAIPNVNLAILVVFVGIRAGLTIFAYLFFNPWPWINPWRYISSKLPNGFVEYPERLSYWPAVLGLILLIWVEVITPVNSAPWFLAAIIVLYSILTLIGALLIGPDTWFVYCDPISVVFRMYGEVSVFKFSDGSVEIRSMGASLKAGLPRDMSVVAFILLIVWELTFSGFIVTEPGAIVITALVETGVPVVLSYLLLLVIGYVVFLWVFVYASNLSRDIADTYLSSRYLSVRFAAPLMGIAAGYHLAHYFNFMVSLLPSVQMALMDPLSPPVNPVVYSLPSWMGVLDAVFVVLGHLLAVWVAHGVSFELFTGRLQAIRSQYPFIAVMILFTMLSLWLVSLPGASPPYVDGIW